MVCLFYLVYWLFGFGVCVAVVVACLLGLLWFGCVALFCGLFCGFVLCACWFVFVFGCFVFCC